MLLIYFNNKEFFNFFILYLLSKILFKKFYIYRRKSYN